MEDKVDDLTKLVAGHVEQFHALDGQLSGIVAEKGELAKELAGFGKSLVVIEQQTKDLRGWKEGFGTIDQLKVDLALLRKENEDLKRWQEELKKQKKNGDAGLGVGWTPFRCDGRVGSCLFLPDRSELVGRLKWSRCSSAASTSPWKSSGRTGFQARVSMRHASSHWHRVNSTQCASGERDWRPLALMCIPFGELMGPLEQCGDRSPRPRDVAAIQASAFLAVCHARAHFRHGEWSLAGILYSTV